MNKIIYYIDSGKFVKFASELIKINSKKDIEVDGESWESMIKLWDLAGRKYNVKLKQK